MLRFAASLALASSLSVAVFGQSWQCYGGNSQHSGGYNGTSQTAAFIQWQAPLSDSTGNFGNATLTHYAAPMVTPSNTVVHGYRMTTTVAGNYDFDNWNVIGRNGKTGAQVWQMTTDYSAAMLNQPYWTSVYPVTLFQSGSSTGRGVAAAAAGGSIEVRASADSATGEPTRMVFYTTVKDFTANQAAYAPIKICTPLTADSVGNIYFGYEVTATVPSKVASLGTGGIVKLNLHTGAAIYKSVQQMGVDPSVVRPAINCAPALTTDGSTIYVGLVDVQLINGVLQGTNSWLAKVSTSNLATKASVFVTDPSTSSLPAYLIDESSASPMIGPDGHVFMGVFGNQWRESHGWMLQYDGNLNQNDSKGVRWPTGAFGWDDTAVVVPTNMVPTYKGKATYLILTKYNNYDDDSSDGAADGSNKIAVLDPTNNTLTRDRFKPYIPVMNEVITILAPNQTGGDPAHPDSRYEWCINSAAIDINRKSAILNSEDGHMYRWSFVTNSITEAVDLSNPTGEAYTETAIGPDGQIYAINNTTLFAIGSTAATAVSAYQGTGAKGNLQSIVYADGQTYSVQSVSTPAGQSAGIEADFTLTATNPATLNVWVNVSASAGANGSISAYNYVTKTFDSFASGSVTANLAFYTASASSPAANYVGPKGKVRILVQAVAPNAGAKQKFTLAADFITCKAQ